MWVYCLSDLQLESHVSTPQSLQEVLLITNDLYLDGHIKATGWVESENRFIEGTRREPLLVQSEQV